MKKFGLITLLGLLSVGLPTIASAWTGYRGADVDVDILSAHGGDFRMIPVNERGGDRDTVRAYLEAQPGEAYKIRVRNRSAQRVGLVIAVDGRNIISGKKSHLRPKERMYILGPYQSAVYKGWRTGRNRVNEFYFTDDIDSYAGAFGDYTAMGVIAVAVFEERGGKYQYEHEYNDGYGGKESHSNRAPGDKSRSAPTEKYGSEPGTGFGDERYSPTRRVEFEPERHAANTWFIKYEWRETLCEKGLIRCRYANNRNYNRFWDDRYSPSFAPYPPGRSHRSRW